VFAHILWNCERGAFRPMTKHISLPPNSVRKLLDAFVAHECSVSSQNLSRERTSRRSSLQSHVPNVALARALFALSKKIVLFYQLCKMRWCAASS